MMVKEKEIITNAYECTKFHECAVLALWLRTSHRCASKVGLPVP